MLGARRHDRRDARRDPQRELHQGAARGHYDVLYANHNGRVAHEMIFDLRPFKHGAGRQSTRRTSPSG